MNQTGVPISVLSSSSDAGQFSASEYFLGLARRAAEANAVTRISHREMGDVVIDPLRRRYTANVANFEMFCTTPAAEFDLSAGGSASRPDHGSERDLAELMWIAAYHASAGRLLDECSKFDVVTLLYWPNLSRLPATPNTSRLCALLIRRPTTIHLARKLLGMDEDETYRIYSAALSAGFVAQVTRHQPKDKSEAEPEAETAPAAPASGRSVLSLLWNKIAGL